jgi:cation-transporting ATPase E
MNTSIGLIIKKYNEVAVLLFRNLFSLINFIIFLVVGLLLYIGDSREGVFLGIIVFLNVIIGITQDIRAWLVLEKLNLLTALSVTRIDASGMLSEISPDEINKNDQIKLKLGDQIPRDGIVLTSVGLEVNNALITGESTSFLKREDEELLAGSIVTAGSGVMKVNSVYEDSRMAKMTVKIKKYSRNDSPIQSSINMAVTYAGYFLIVVILFVIVRGQIIKEPVVSIIEQIGSLASVLVPQGLIIAITLLFAYGARHLFNRHVLLQEMNAVEKLSHIKNLCMDKTGTLTENVPSVELLLTPEGADRVRAERLAFLYSSLVEESSQTVQAIHRFLLKSEPVVAKKDEIEAELPFSSTRKYAGLLLKNESGGTLLLGAPEILAQGIIVMSEKKWIESVISEYTLKGRRVVCLMQSTKHELPQNLDGVEVSIVAVFILENNLREGIPDAIDYFQRRGVRVRVISGDNIETIRAVVTSAGILFPERGITGEELEMLTPQEFSEKVISTTIFARIKPEQKEMIITSLKRDGFTAMVGDGANDALAIKIADLGIAMFDGAKATRQLAGVVLIHNSFIELPGGVILADSIVTNIKVYASLFFNQTFLGLFVFIFLSILGYSFPFTPLNITFINYFTVGIPSLLIFYWTIHPKQNAKAPLTKTSFLKDLLPFPIISAIIQSICVVGIYLLSTSTLNHNNPNTIVALTFIIFGYIFFAFAPRVYGEAMSIWQALGLWTLFAFEVIVLVTVFTITFVEEFFNVSLPQFNTLLLLIPFCLLYLLLQYVISRLITNTTKDKVAG